MGLVALTNEALTADTIVDEATNIAGNDIREAINKERKADLVIDLLELNYQMFTENNEPTDRTNNVHEIVITGCAHVLEITPYYIRLKIENGNNSYTGVGQYFTDVEITACITGLNIELNS